VTEPFRYSEVGDMLLGQMTLASGIDGNKFVDAAADEIHMKLGFTYKVPIQAPEGQELPVPVSLLLKRISVNISTGLAIRASIGPSTQGDNINAYAATLLTEGRRALDAIASDAMPLEGAVRLAGEEEHTRGPRYSNVDSYSQVEAFYGQFTGGTQDMFRPSPLYGLLGVDPHSG
jgi:hypothetical protein